MESSIIFLEYQMEAERATTVFLSVDDKGRKQFSSFIKNVNVFVYF